MVEFIDNLTQLLAALAGFLLSGASYLKSRRQPYFLLCCFYGCFGFGMLYWLLPLTAYFISIGDALYNLIVGALMAAMLWTAVRGLVWQKKQPNQSRRFFHFAVIGFLVLENCLWLSSYPWVGDTLANPYFWFDFAVTASLLMLFPAVRKAVQV